VSFVVKSTTAQLKKENVTPAAAEKTGALDAIKKSLTPAAVLFFLIFWMLWSINSNLSALQSAVKSPPV